MRRAVALTSSSWLVAVPTAAAYARRAKGYKFFEDQYPAEQPPDRFQTYEDQMLGGQVKNCDPKPVLTEHEKLVQLHDWKKDPEGGSPFQAPENYGWIEEWGPEPGEEGHNDWYKKPREYMSDEEKAKFDMGFQVPLRKHHHRHQKLPYQDHMTAAYMNLYEKNPKAHDFKKKNYTVHYDEQEKYDTIGQARADFLDDWLQKPGVTPENVAKKIGDYNGTAKLHNIKKVPRRPDWELAPKPDDDDDDDD
mmetsp:Transcript_53280/g.163913  ORF Transcript_53280/g.163913 Transcript_53280/m.163913 type:complete len:249 (-) Transcript_53280:23-769(-)|eukprot:CAMPEP_0174835354 /NCGR_PEP_ID=MMETSP1114-20130205/5363_1 /TAXON_ID=312471 /ORGANISM="Neobodo designis, Strain CCAP 1951/1" /LENGTH=248 /DNA_ID=CAMNT_0016069301 /DNA_START=39 /DNA_END=785 /DNA_ORIENTATION=+